MCVLSYLLNFTDTYTRFLIKGAHFPHKKSFTKKSTH